MNTPKSFKKNRINIHRIIKQSNFYKKRSKNHYKKSQTGILNYKKKKKMGCNSSKNKVHIVGTVPSTTTTSSNKKEPRKSGSAKRRSKKSAMGSQDSLGGVSVTSENRQGSASSKVSKHTIDSGFDDSEYQHIITENSDPSKVKHIEDTFQTPRDLGKFETLLCHVISTDDTVH